jgi:endonuclease YncB( thermonuclease family)
MDGADHLGEPVSAFRALVLALLFAASSATSQEIVAPAVRDVTPPGMTPGPKGEGPLIREAVPPRPPAPPRWRRYFLPETTDAATFRIDGRLTIRISGATPPPVGETCAFADGAPWPCGRTALHALRMYLRGRAIECYFPPVDGVAEVTAPCRVGGADLGAWLLAAGWARPNDLATDAYLTAAAGARCANLGIWRGAERPDYCPPRPVSEPEPAPEVFESAASPWLPD